jgi:hypothetical protein
MLSRITRLSGLLVVMLGLIIAMTTGSSSIRATSQWAIPLDLVPSQNTTQIAIGLDHTCAVTSSDSVIYAEDDAGPRSRPRTIDLTTANYVYLPTVAR